MIYAGIDVGGTNIKAALVSGDAQILEKRIIPFPGGGYKNVAGIVEDLIRRMLSQGGYTPEDAASIGLAVPGSIDPGGSRVIHAYNLDFHDAPLKREMERRFSGIPVALGNDADAAALAELYRGALRGCRTGVLLTLGTGVGGGVILNGRLFKGGMGHGVELGHMCLIHGGPVCTCGNRGCMETVCTASWLAEQGRRAARKDRGGLIAQRAGNNLERVNGKTVFDCAKAGDKAALAIVSRYIDYLSSAISSVAVLLDPEVVALGGGVSLAGEFLFAPLRKQVKEKSFFKFNHKIVAAEMGNDAGVVGAAMLWEHQNHGRPGQGKGTGWINRRKGTKPGGQGRKR